MPNFRAIKISVYFIRGTKRPGGNYHESSDCVEYPEYLPTLIKLPKKKYLQKFSYPKKSQNQNFQKQKNPSIIPVTSNPE